MESQKDCLASTVLVERNMVFQLFTRPNTVNLMSIDNVLNPRNAPQAYEQGKFIMGAECDKTGYTLGLGTRNRTVFPNAENPQNCVVFSMLNAMVESEQQITKPNLSYSDLFMDSLQGAKKRPKAKLTKQGKVSSSTSSNTKFRNRFRQGKSVA